MCAPRTPASRAGRTGSRALEFFADGCRCNRDTVAKIEASPLEVAEVEHGELPKSPPIVRPMAWGSAILAG